MQSFAQIYFCPTTLAAATPALYPRTARHRLQNRRVCSMWGSHQGQTRRVWGRCHSHQGQTARVWGYLVSDLDQNPAILLKFYSLPLKNRQL
jgi:hypothetical protein